MVLEELIDEMGTCGWFQLLLTILLMGAKMPIVCSLLLPSVSGLTPNWWCVPTGLQINATLDNISYKLCHVNGTTCSRIYKEKTVTIISEWNLVCENKWINKVITSIQMSGLLVAILVAGQLTGMLGRKKALYFSLIGHTIFNLIGAFSVSWQMYAVMRFLIGGSCGLELLSCYLLGMEFIGRRWRPFFVAFPSWQAGICLFALFAWLYPNWRHLHIVSAIMTLPFLAGWFIVPESMRWLTVKGRLKEAELVVDKIAKYNRKDKPDDTITRLKYVADQERYNLEKNKKYSYIDVFRGWNMIKKTSCLCFIWFSCASVYYGITFNVQKMSGNLYINLVLLSVVELPGNVITCFSLRTLGRRWTAFGLFLITGVCGVGTLAVELTADEYSKGIMLNILALVAKFALSTGWDTMHVFTPELYPTVVRGPGFAASECFARFGGITAPLILLVESSVVAPYVIMGCLMLLSALCVVTLTETRDIPAEDTLPTKERGARKLSNSETDQLHNEDNEEDVSHL